MNGRPSFGCAEGATEISPGLEQRDYPGFTSHKIIFSLSSPNEERAGVRSRTFSPQIFVAAALW